MLKLKKVFVTLLKINSASAMVNATYELWIINVLKIIRHVRSKKINCFSIITYIGLNWMLTLKSIISKIPKNILSLSIEEAPRE